MSAGHENSQIDVRPPRSAGGNPPRPGVHFAADTPTLGGGAPFRVECDLRDCDVEGEIPTDLNGSFFRVGPDYQYPPAPGNIPFDGEGHVTVFRFHNGHVDFQSRFVRTQRYKSQASARKRLFGVYRNPHTDDPSVAGISRGTANTNVVFHNGMLFALKEDSPPVAMDPRTLATLDDYHTFNGGLKSLTFTAHPKLDHDSGEMIGFGYEAKGEASDDVAIYAIDRSGNVTWEAWVKVPYAGMLHDFGVTRSHIAFLCIPMATDVEQMQRGGTHFAWDSHLPTWFGVMRRGGDGTDLRWYRGPERCATHVLGAYSDGDRLFVDMDMARKNQFPFFPNRYGERFDPKGAGGRLTRLSVDLSKKGNSSYDMEILYSQMGFLPRQDDRYQTQPYRYGFMPVIDPAMRLDTRLADLPFPLPNSYVRFDHQTRTTSSFFVGNSSSLQECCFVPRHARAAEGDGYLIGIANRLLEGGRADLVILDAQHLDEGAVATVKLPFPGHPQVHGHWVAEQLLNE
jgi:carotenoid cleavage dioxygenase-like enzyme